VIYDIEVLFDMLAEVKEEENYYIQDLKTADIIARREGIFTLVDWQV